MKREKGRDRKTLAGTMLGLLMLAAVCLIMRGGRRLMEAASSDVVKTSGERPCVVIDAGHGGNDPGKVGIDGSLEKDINLQVALKLQKFLQMQDVEAVLTRDSDSGLYDENASNKKVQDMKNRVAFIEQQQPDLVVSIHQNSYHEEYVHGAQVFYYATSGRSRELAERIQQVMAKELDPDNARQAKANDSYYLLKKTSVPIVIVECGFLSNREEAQKLSSPAYQEKAAWAIHLAVIQWLNDSVS